MSKIQKEKRVISLMVGIYCRKKHCSPQLCQECKILEQYAHLRLNQCRYGEEKGFCSNCLTQCYAKEKKQQIKEVMRFSGPYMLIYHPILLLKHIFQKN